MHILINEIANSKMQFQIPPTEKATNRFPFDLSFALAFFHVAMSHHALSN